MWLLKCEFEAKARGESHLLFAALRAKNLRVNVAALTQFPAFWKCIMLTETEEITTETIRKFFVQIVTASITSRPAMDNIRIISG
jgi:hypothetical protein